MELTTQNVREVLDKCFFTKEEADAKPTDYKVGEGVKMKLGFHPERLKANEENITSMLSQLPDEFISGGGWSFLNACNRKDGIQWADMHRSIDELICLGVASGHVTILMREMASVMPGGVPYFSVTISNIVE